MAEDRSEDADVVTAAFGSCGARTEDNASTPSVWGSSGAERSVGDAAAPIAMREIVTRVCIKRIFSMRISWIVRR